MPPFQYLEGNTIGYTEKPINLCLISIAAFVGGIISGRPQLTKSSEMGITGPIYLLMSANKLDLASNTKSSQESSSSNLCH
jgi:hypothetical protein